MTRWSQTWPCSLGTQSSPSGPGCLIVVTAAELSTLDLLLTAARRRLAHPSLEFPKRIATRRNGPFDAEISVTRTLFRQIEQDGRLVATWEAGGHQFGLPDSLLKLLLEGRRAVIAAPADVIPALQGIDGELRILRLAGRLEAALAPLAPRARLQRIVGPRLADRLGSRAVAARTDLIPYTGDMPSVVRALTESLVRIEQEHRASVGAATMASDCRPADGGTRLRRGSATAAAL